MAEADIRTQSGHVSLCGDGLCIGRDSADAVSADAVSADAVSAEYTAPCPFNGGRIVKVEFHSGDDLYINLERHMAAAMSRD